MVHSDSIDFYVPIIDNYGDMGFAANLAFSIHEKHPRANIRFFSDDRGLFRKFFGENAPEWIGYIPLGTLNQADPPSPSGLIFNFFDHRIPKEYLTRFPCRKTIVSFSYFLLHEGIGSLHGTTYVLESGYDRVTHFIPSLLPGGWGIIINPEIERRKKGFSGLPESEARKRFLWEIIGNCHPELVSGSSTYLATSEINGKIPDRSPEWRSKSICEKKWISIFVYPDTLPYILPVIDKETDTVFFIFGGTGNEKMEISENIVHMPFLPLEDYGVFQSLCDANIVRGENSLCQGLISGKPVLWDIYKESNGAHREKTEDFIGWISPYFGDSTDYTGIARNFMNNGSGASFERFIRMIPDFKEAFAEISMYVRGECDLIGNLEEILKRVQDDDMI